MNRLLFFIVSIFILNLAQSANAYTDREKELYSLVRCMACDGQSIIGSDAEFARSMREYITEQIESGRNNDEIISNIRNTYGDVIFFEPPYEKATYILWFLPLFLVVIGILVVVLVQKKYKLKN